MSKINIEHKSKRFFGERYLVLSIYQELKVNMEKQNIQEVKKKLVDIFPSFAEKNQSIDNELNKLFSDFLFNGYQFCYNSNFDFTKTSCFIEIISHIFEQSFEKFLEQDTSSDLSFNLFREIIVRHTLFRPPHSILVFNLGELKNITKFMLTTFYQHYTLYFNAFTPFKNVEIRTFEPFKDMFPAILPLTDGQIVNRSDIRFIDEYMIDKDTGLTPEQLEEIMRGDSIHLVPAKKKELWLKLKQERDKKARIDREMNKELERLNNMMQDKMRLQDENFLVKLADLKAKPAGKK